MSKRFATMVERTMDEK